MSRPIRRAAGALLPLGLFVAVAAAQPVAGAGQGVFDDRTVLNPLAEISVDSLSGFRDRPLFTPSRRPPPPPVVEAPEPEPEPMVEDIPEPVEESEPPSVTLAGILEIDDVPVAMLREMDGGETLSVRVGEQVQEWTVSAIGEADVMLELDGREHEIRIFEPGNDVSDPSRVMRPGAAGRASPAFDGRTSTMRETAAERFRRARDAALRPDRGEPGPAAAFDPNQDGSASEDSLDDGSAVDDGDLTGDDAYDDSDLTDDTDTMDDGVSADGGDGMDDSDFYGDDEDMPLDAADDFDPEPDYEGSADELIDAGGNGG